MNSHLKKRLIIFVAIVFLIIILKNGSQKDPDPHHNPGLIENLSFNFNETGFPFYVVPNIVHYILFDIKDIGFGHFVSLLSVMKNQKPDLIYIHCNCHQLSGDYYERALRVADKTNTQLIVRTIERPTQIFGQKLGYLNWHSSDIMRIQMLLEFGGIYFDNDVYVVESLDVYRNYEMTLYWIKDISTLESSIIIANKNARFLKLWLDSYHEYKRSRYKWNGAELPTKRFLKKKPDLVHNIKFGSDSRTAFPLLHRRYDENWSKAFIAYHLW